MVTNLKFYVLTVVSIFLALAIGIFIGFMFDAQEILISQKEDIASQLEERLDDLKSENEIIKTEISTVSDENARLHEFNRMVYEEIIRDKLNGLRIAIIETNDDYIYTSLKQTLEISGAEISSIVTIKDNLLSSEEDLEIIYKNINVDEDIDDNVLELTIEQIMGAVISGESNEMIQRLNNEGMIFVSEGLNSTEIIKESNNQDNVENIDNDDIVEASNDNLDAIDYIIITGGSKNEISDRFHILDEEIISVAKKANVPIIGVEKQSVKYSYIEKYKDNRISTVDNVDTIIGKVALILAMDGRPGNYGVKPSSESLVPETSTTIINSKKGD